MITLEFLIKANYGVNGDVYACTNPKQYEVVIDGIPLSFIGPSDTSLIVVNRNMITELYYKVVIGLMFEYLDITIDNPFRIGSKVIDRATVWKVYDTFDIKYATIKNQQSVISANLESTILDAVSDSIELSNFDKILAYLETATDMDEYDIAELITPTMKERLMAELANKRMIKGVSPSATLF
jgi:hypothetical protein